MSSRAKENKKYEAEFESLRQQLSSKIEENLKLQSQLAEESKSYNLRLSAYQDEYSAKNQALRLLEKRVQEIQQNHLNESNQYKVKLDNLNANLEAKTAALGAEEEEKERLIEKIELIQNEKNLVVGQLNNRESEIANLNLELDTKSRLSAKLETEFKFELENCKSDLQNKESLFNLMQENQREQVNNLNKNIFELQGQLDKAREDNSTLKANLALLKTKHEEETKTLETKLSAFDAEIEKRKRDYSSLENELMVTKSGYEEKISSMRKSLNDIKSELEAKESEASRLSCNKQEIEAKYSAEVNSLQTKISAQEIKQKETECRLEASNSNVQQLNSEKQTMNKKVMDLEAEYNKKVLEHQHILTEYERTSTLQDEMYRKFQSLESYFKKLKIEANTAQKNNFTLKTNLEIITKEYGTLKKNLNEFKAVLSERFNEINALKDLNQRLIEHMNTVELSFASMNNQLKFEQEQHEVVQKRLENVLMKKQEEIKTLITKLTAFDAEIEKRKKENSKLEKELMLIKLNL